MNDSFRNYVSTRGEKDYHWQKCLKIHKKAFPLARMGLKIRFHQTEKQSQQWQECLKFEEKNGFHQPENQFLLIGIRLFFKNWIFRFPQTEKKTLNKRILFQLDRKSVSTTGMENSFKNTFLLDGKTASIDRNIQKIKENGCQQQ